MEGEEDPESNGTALGQGKIGFLQLKNGLYYGEHDLNGFPHGSGILLFTSADIYIGWFKAGSFHGHGLLLFSNGSCACGSFKRGLFDGQCCLRLGNGDLIFGWFEDGKRNGICIHYSTEKLTKEVRQYKQGQFESMIRAEEGEITEDGTIIFIIDLYEYFSLESFDIEQICAGSGLLYYESKNSTM